MYSLLTNLCREMSRVIDDLKQACTWKIVGTSLSSIENALRNLVRPWARLHMM